TQRPAGAESLSTLRAGDVVARIAVNVRISTRKSANTGTSLRNLMTRMGRDSPRGALIYQHASADADRAIADAVNAAVTKARTTGKKAKRKPRGKPEDGAAG